MNQRCLTLSSFIMTGLALILSLELSFAANSASGTAVPINGVAAVVNESIITERVVQREIKGAKAQYLQHHMPLPNDKELRQQIIEGLIAKKLMLQIAKQNHISATPAEVNDMMENIAKQNGSTVAVLKQHIAQEHISEKQFTKKLAEQIAITKLQQQAISGRIQLTPEKIAAFKTELAKEQSVTEYHIMDYVAPLSESASGEQQATALKLIQTSLNQPSIEKQDLDWQSLDNLPDLFATNIVNMRPGETSAPILAGNGYHVLKLIATRQTGRNISDDQARDLLFQKQSQDVLKQWIEQLKENAYIKIYS